jgi:hypothetical protein
MQLLLQRYFVTDIVRIRDSRSDPRIRIIGPYKAMLV